MMNLYEVARFLEAHDNYDILTHAYPDGDTLAADLHSALRFAKSAKKQELSQQVFRQSLPIFRKT